VELAVMSAAADEFEVDHNDLEFDLVEQACYYKTNQVYHRMSD